MFVVCSFVHTLHPPLGARLCDRHPKGRPTTSQDDNVLSTRLCRGTCRRGVDDAVNNHCSAPVSLHVTTVAAAGRVLICMCRYYCRYFLVGAVSASDHLMLTALVSFASNPNQMPSSQYLGRRVGNLRCELLSRCDEQRLSPFVSKETCKKKKVLLFTAENGINAPA